jgi:predicted RNA-binding protein
MFAALNMALHARLKRDLALIGLGVDVVVFEVQGVGPVEVSDFSKTEELIEGGYRRARDVLDGYDEAVLARGATRVGVGRGSSFVDRTRRALGR